MVRISSLFLLLSACLAAFAEEPVLADRNGDGAVRIVAFGDSITAGLGDGIEPGVTIIDLGPGASGGGYPQRVAAWGGLPVENAGKSGEEISAGGAERFLAIISRSNSDIVVIFEGVNDAYREVSASEYSALIQRLINVSSVFGSHPLLATIPPPCCDRLPRAALTREYNARLRAIASYNQIPLVDLERVWRTTCLDQNACELFNVPEGLHPNKRGYDAIAQAVLAALHGIDVFAENGPSELEAALGLPSGSVIIRPDNQSVGR